MIEFKESIDIEAPCNLVWQTLTDFGAYHLWNSFMSPRRGRFAEGATMEMRLRPPFQPTQHIEPTFERIAPGREFILGGQNLLCGSLQGTLSVTLAPLSLESVRLTQTLTASGFMAQYNLGKLMKTWKYGLSIMAGECKLRSEVLYDEALMRTSYDTLPSFTRPTISRLAPVSI